MSRSFTVTHVLDVSEKINENLLGGRYLSSDPASAAKKAAQKICKYSNVKGRCSFVIYIKETTKGSANKIFKYKVRKLKNDKKIIRDGVEIHYHHQWIVKSLQDYPNLLCKKNSKSKSR